MRLSEFSILALAALALAAAACRKEAGPVPVPGPVPDPLPDSLCIADSSVLSRMWRDEYACDSIGGIGDIRYARCFKNGAYVKDPGVTGADDDFRFEFHTAGGAVRYASAGDGYAITLKEEAVADYTIGRYGARFKTADGVLRVTHETVRPYSQDKTGYGIYTGEWLTLHLENKPYFTNNKLRYFKPTLRNNTTILPGYDVTIYYVNIKESGDIEYPYYRLAILRKANQYASFGLLLYKTRTEGAPDDDFLDMISSFSCFKRRGSSKNYIPVQEPRPNPGWNDETKAYYQKLLTQQTLDFGVFSASMESSFDSSFDYQHERISAEKQRLEGPECLDHKYEIMPTYTALSYANIPRHFPSEMAEEFAGGNGFNGRSVLQFTYQFTTNNNNVLNPDSCPTPCFDIMRGKYDGSFRTLAREIKAYRKPVLFRLNNEMNSDWTSYCGMMTLNDPEIFVLTWRRLYDIFREEGVDNCIWIFNPIATSCPYSYWGEDLAYYPGNDYVQILGLTNYEFNNGSSPASFHSLYSSLWRKNEAVFGKLPAIISEFACGAGGETTGELYRNKDSQARWVADMFDEFADRQTNVYLANIKGAVWFSANDYSGEQISNCLRLDPCLTDTFKAFREGFAKLEKK